jgi:hypothetical protein
MSDEKLERGLHLVLDRMMAEQASPSLRARVGAVLASPRNTRGTWLRFAPRLAGGLIAAVMVVALGALLATQSTSTGPAPVPSPSPTASAAAPSATPAIIVPVGTPPTSWSVVPDAPVLDFGSVNWAVDAVAPDGTFVAIVSRSGESPVALRSGDGTTWTAAGPFPGTSDMWVNAITRRGDMLIAVGTGGHTAAGAAWTSSDGVTWQRAADQPAFAQAALDRVAAGPVGVVAVDRFDGLLLVSVDGATWSSVSLGAAGAVRVNDVAATDTGFVAVGSVGSSAAVWTSSDLEHWARASFPDGSDASAQLVAVAAQGQRLVALGAVPAPGEAANDPWTGLGAWLSTDGGASWTLSGTTLRGDAPVLYPPSMPGLYALRGGFVAFGNPGPGALAVWTSSDGTSWRPATVQAASDAAGRTIAISGGRAVIAGNDLGTGMGGSRAIFWTGEVGGMTVTPSPMPVPSASPVVAAPSGSMPPISITPWTGLQIAARPSGPVSARSVAAWSGGYLALGATSAQGQLPGWISRDGRSWVALPAEMFGPASVALAAACANGILVAVQSPTGQTTVWRSSDGASWTSSPAPQMRLSQDSDLVGGRWGALAILQGSPYRIAFSADGITWQSVSLPGDSAFSVQGVAAFGAGFVAVGDEGTPFGSPKTGSPVAWWSADGLHWTRAVVGPHPGDGFVDVHAAAKGLVALSTTGGTPGLNSFWTSPDGRSWTVSTADPLGVLGEGFMAGVPGSANGLFSGDGARLLGYGVRAASQPLEYWVSQDGAHWTRLALTGDTTAALAGQVTPFLMHDGVLFSGDQGSWFGTAAGP